MASESRKNGTELMAGKEFQTLVGLPGTLEYQKSLELSAPISETDHRQTGPILFTPLDKAPVKLVEINSVWVR